MLLVNHRCALGPFLCALEDLDGLSVILNIAMDNYLGTRPWR